MADPKDDDDDPDIPEQKAVEHTEKTGEIAPSGAWPEGDEETRTPA
jgi:hypothetical protein